VTQTVHADPEPIVDVPLRRLLWVGAGGRLFATYWGCVVVVDVAAPHRAAVAGVAVVVVLCSLNQPPSVAVWAAGIGWLFVTGFVANLHGELALHGPADAARLVLLVAAGTGTAVLTSDRGPR
jgi:hypothetical protein